MESHLELPKPSAPALAHSQRLADSIRERIAAGHGWIDFAEFMNLALYAPGLGYYSAGARKFGPDGDFVTAPEISPLFGRCIARSLTGILSECSPGNILELGAGTGAMAAEILRKLERDGVLPERYLILEISADLRERQMRTIKERVPSQAGRVAWLDALPDAGIDGVILANEVLDALPVTRFTIDHDGLYAQGVTVEAGRFRWRRAPASRSLHEQVAAIQEDLDDRIQSEYTSEIRPSLPAFINGVGGALNRGLILLIDYGLPRREFYHPDRNCGTLVCHYRHRAHPNPFLYPGLQDITAWVDFTAVAEAADKARLQVAGYTTQAHFLLAAGVGQELAGQPDETVTANGLRARTQMSTELKTLMMPGEMGEFFKVMALGRGIDTLPAAFSGRDLRHLL
jgi:SAM-dependent MidA family methyltransferase